MKSFKKIIKDVLYVSKITGVGNKKLLILIVTILAQLSAITDIAIISVFASIIADQFTNIPFVNSAISFILDFPILVAIMVILRFLFLYYQQTIIKNLEFNVNLNIKSYLLNEVFEKRNYSIADTYFFVNTLSGHIAYFYSSFSGLITSSLQIFIYSIYLLIVDIRSVGVFIIGVLVLFFPIKKLLNSARTYMNNSYYKGQDANREIQRVVENMFLIKILKKETYELDRFQQSLSSMYQNMLLNYKVGLLNGFLPSFLTLFGLSIILGFTNLAKVITLDFIGVTLRLFQALGNLTGMLNQIINSHVHIEKFYEIDNQKYSLNKENFIIDKSTNLIANNLSFNYINSDIDIFKDVNFEIKRNSHILVTGPNGSGKSTLLGLIAGVLYSSSGEIKTFSNKFGYIGATPLIFESSLLENLTYGNDKEITNKEIVDYLKYLETFKEEGSYDLNRVVSNKSLSSGQMQKIAFVRAFLADIDILLLDEATANLDESSKNKIFEILREKEVTIINSTHDPGSFKNVDGNLKISLDNENRKITFLT